MSAFQPAQLRAARVARGWTQEQLAVAAGAHRGAILGYESGAIAPQPRRLRQIAEALGVDIHSLVAIDHTCAFLVDYRGWAGLSQHDAAEALGVGLSRYSAWERGVPTANLPAAAERVAAAFRITVEEMRAAEDRTQAAYRAELERGGAS